LHQRLAEESYPRGDWRVKGRVGREQAGVQPDPSLMQQAVASNRCAARKIPCQHRRPVHALGLTRSTARKSRAADRRLHPIELLVLIANILYRPCAAASSSAQETFVKLRSGPPMRAQGQGVHLLRPVPVTPLTAPFSPAVSSTADVVRPPMIEARRQLLFDGRGAHPARPDRGPPGPLQPWLMASAWPAHCAVPPPPGLQARRAACSLERGPAIALPFSKAGPDVTRVLRTATSDSISPAHA